MNRLKMTLLMTLLMSLAMTLTQAQCYTNGAWYCYPNVTNSTGVPGGLKYVNTTTQGIGWTVLMFALWIVMLFAMGNYNILARLMVSGLSFSLITAATTILTWTPLFLPVVFSLISVGSFAALIFSTAT